MGGLIRVFYTPDQIVMFSFDDARRFLFLGWGRIVNEAGGKRKLELEGFLSILLFPLLFGLV